MCCYANCKLHELLSTNLPRIGLVDSSGTIVHLDEITGVIVVCPDELLGSEHFKVLNPKWNIYFVSANRSSARVPDLFRRHLHDETFRLAKLLRLPTFGTGSDQQYRLVTLLIADKRIWGVIVEPTPEETFGAVAKAILEYR